MAYNDIPKPSTPYNDMSRFLLETGYLLQENGDYVLQENGDRIILNYQGGYEGLNRPQTPYSNINKPA